MRAYFKSSEPANPILYVSIVFPVCIFTSRFTREQINELSKPPDSKHAIGRSVVSTRFFTADIKKRVILNSISSIDTRFSSPKNVLVIIL